MASAERAVRFLNQIGRGDLAGLLARSTYDYETEDLWYDIVGLVIAVTSPRVYNDAIEGLPEWDHKRITEAIHSTHQGPESQGSAPSRLVLKFTEEEVADPLLPDIIIQRNQMIAVATGRGKIQDIDDYYKVRQRRIATALAARGIENPIPFDSLWDWYRKWKTDFGTYSERRRFISDLFKPVLAQLVSTPEAVPIREPTGWERVDRAATKARQRLDLARHEEDYQTVGLLCREVFISLGQAVYDPNVHASPDGVQPSPTDAGRMIESFFVQAAAGSTNENVRRHAKAALQLAVELQHKRTADFRAAALCLEATSSVMTIVAILSGQHDRETS